MIDGSALRAFRERLEALAIPGAVLVEVLPDGSVSVHCVGKRSASSKATVDAQTVFEGASLSKPCFAFALLKLAQAGSFPLDEPLAPYSENLRALEDSGAQTITARQLLSHTSGLPNWRSASREFRTWYTPGERFSYSSEGYVCLQQAAEAISGKSAHQLVSECVFEPLGMHRRCGLRALVA